MMVDFNNYPDPTKADLERLEFETVWQAIKGWDICRLYGRRCSSATGNDVMHILNAIKNFGYIIDQTTINQIVKESLPVEQQHLSENIANQILQEIVFRRITQ